MQFEAADGYRISATLWDAEVGAAGIVLLHQCDGDRQMYRTLGSRLAATGRRVLSFDFRGLGDSASEALDLVRKPSRQAWNRAEEGFSRDADAAFRYLLSRDPTTNAVAVLGASCGGREQIGLAERFPRIASMIFLSARLSVNWQDRVLALPAMPLLLIAAEGDRGAAAAARRIRQSLEDRDLVDALILDGSDHGAPLLTRYPHLIDTILEWLTDTGF